LQRARDGIEANVNWLQSDVESLPFRDGSFDIVYCVGVLSYLKEDTAAVAEMSRVVRDGGLVIISVPNLFMLNKWLDPYYYFAWLPCKLIGQITTAAYAKAEKTKNFGTESIRRYGYKKINRLFAIHGMSEIDSINVSFGPFTLWRKEFFSLESSIKISEMLRKAGEKKSFQLLRFFTNHWITCLTKVRTSP
jgi:ubiquinone/menaquinone biosynthesis C-methylase UbiE